MEDKQKYEEMTIVASQSFKERQYWMKKLSGDLEKTVFPYDYIEKNYIEKSDIEKSDEEYPLRRLEFEFPPEIGAVAMKISNNSDPRLFMILSSVIVVLLHRYTGNNDILMGTSIDKQEMDGNFINTVLVLRNRLTHDMTFKELLVKMRETVREAMENRNYPIEALLYDLNIPHSDIEFPLFDIAVLLANIHCKAYLDNIKLNIIFSFLRTGDKIGGVVEYNPLCFTDSTVQMLIKRMIAILADLVINLDRKISDIELLTDDEKQQLVTKFNSTRAEYPRDKLLHELFEEQVEKNPGNTAIVFAGKQMTYLELNEKSNGLARLLRDKGIMPDTLVGLVTEISLEMVIGMMSILKAGGAFLPIEPDYPSDRLQYIVKDSQTPVILTQSRFKNIIQFDGEMLDIKHGGVFPGGASNLGKISQPHHLAYVIYTSGSTGKPKGVMISHQSIVNQIFGFKTLFYHRTHLLNHVLMAPFTFDPSVQHVFSPLTYGAQLFLIPKSMKDEPKELMNFILANKIDIFDAVPSQIDILLESSDNFSGVKLKYIILAGEVFSKNLYSKIKERLSVEKLVNIYGPTEATINTTMYECPEAEYHATIPIGKPLMNYKVFILDGNKKLMPIGVPGEICIGGEGLARGYINNPVLSAGKFVKNPFTAGERLYKTGDIARWLPDGNLEFVGRIDYQVKIRGQRIELEEIDMRLQSHPSVKEAAVIAREDKNKIKYLSAYMVPNGELNISEIREYLMAQLPGYMVPGHFVELKQMPLTPNGKIDRRALAKIQASQKGSDEYIAPRNELEEKLTRLWASELELEKVGIKDNYFNIGGDSIKSIRLMNLINTELKANLKVVDLYVHNTIEELAEIIANYHTAVEKEPERKVPETDEKYDAARQKIDELRKKVMKGK